MLALIAALAVFVSVSAVFVLLARALSNPVEARLSSLAPTAPVRPLDAPISDRVLLPLMDGITRAVISILPNRFVERTSRQLLAAGSPMSTQAFFTMALLSAVAVPALGFFVAAGLGFSAIAIMALILICVAGVAAPFVWLRRRVRMRKAAIWKRLSDAFDLITVCVEAGLGLDAALRQVSLKLRGPLADELAITLRQVGMGRPRRESLEDMGNRVDIPEVTTFVNAIIQAEQLGTSVGSVLRAQAVSLRIRRRQRAEENARRAPVKMVFPLVLFIMPTFFIVTVGPVVVQLVTYLNGK